MGTGKHRQQQANMNKRRRRCARKAAVVQLLGLHVLPGSRVIARAQAQGVEAAGRAAHIVVFVVRVEAVTLRKVKIITLATQDSCC